MARRRMISQEIILDPDFNALSLASQNVFIRLIVVSDDYGVIPANEYTLNKLINIPPRTSLTRCIDEIIKIGLIQRFQFEKSEFLLLKRDRFDEYQSYLIAKRTKSEYLRKSKDFMESEDFQKILGISSDVGTTSIISKEYKVESIKHKDTGERKNGTARPKDIQEVQAYMLSIRCTPSHVHAHEWWEHFNRAEVNWRVKIAGKLVPMLDWKAACRTWKRNAETYGKIKIEPSKKPYTCPDCGQTMPSNEESEHFNKCPRFSKKMGEETLAEIASAMKQLEQKAKEEK